MEQQQGKGRMVGIWGQYMRNEGGFMAYHAEIRIGSCGHGGGDPEGAGVLEPRRREIYKGVTHVLPHLSLSLLLWCAFVLFFGIFMSILLYFFSILCLIK